MEELQGYSYLYRAPQQGCQTFITLHGTGGTEHDLISFVNSIDPNAGIISPKGNVLEKGHARFFASPKNGVFDQDDIEKNSKALVKFVNAAAEKHKFDRNDLIWVGYSNGANITSSIMLIHPDVVQKAILLRPMVVYLPAKPPLLPDTSVLIAAGNYDPLVPLSNTQQLIHLLQQTGALVELFLHQGGHHLEDDDSTVAKRWYSKQGFAVAQYSEKESQDEFQKEPIEDDLKEEPTEEESATKTPLEDSVEASDSESTIDAFDTTTPKEAHAHPEIPDNTEEDKFTDSNEELPTKDKALE